MAKLQLDNCTNFYRGKVRDVYTIGDNKVAMVASDRLSAFDVILPRTIPYKGQVLNQIAAYMLEACKDICPIWLQATPAPQASVGHKCIPYKVEVVVRNYLVGHAWRTYNAGNRTLCGVALPDGLVENSNLPFPIITPSTKADAGHDEDISKEEIINTELVEKSEYEKIEKYALQLFNRGTELAIKQGLILADTKYEFGQWNEEIMLMDEIHTPDSSRYFIAEGFTEKVNDGEKPEQLSKEFVREWLIAKKFMGRENDTMPEITDEKVKEISDRYIKLFEKLLGLDFKPQSYTPKELEININAAIKIL